MANINGKKREAELISSLKQGIVVALHSQGKSYHRIAGIVDDSYSYVSRIIVRDVELTKRFEGSIAEQIMEAAKRISDNKTFSAELEQLAETIKQDIDGGPVINRQAINIFCKRMYAEAIAGLWARLEENQPAHILKYQREVIDAKRSLEGRLIVAPKEIMPANIRETKNAKRPYLVLGHERGAAELCDEEAGMLALKVRSISKQDKRARENAKNAVPRLQSLHHEQVRVICADYFKRNGYDLRIDLQKQIQERALHEIAPVAHKQRTQLAGSGLYKNSD